MTKILMCPPDFYDIDYSINPWMDTNKKVSNNKTDQWNKLKSSYEKSGYEVVLIDPVDGLPDMTYVDSGILYNNIFVPSNFKYKERQGESKYYAEWFEQNGFEIKWIDKDFYFEGHGDTLFAGQKMFFGFGFRSSIESQYEASKIFPEIDIIPIELKDPRFYHLDTCFCPLNASQAIFFPGGFTEKSKKLLEKNIELIEVPEEDALKFACNSLVVDKDVFIPAGASSTNEKLESMGYTIHEIEMSEFIKGGGACKCLSFLVEE